MSRRCLGLWLMAAIQPEKFPWVVASWLTQRRNSLLLSVELMEQGGVWVNECVRMHTRRRWTHFWACHSFACMSVHFCHQTCISVTTYSGCSEKVKTCPGARNEVMSKMCVRQTWTGNTFKLISVLSMTSFRIGSHIYYWKALTCKTWLDFVCS